MSEPYDEPDEVTHMCPPGDSDTMPCCGRSPSELPRTDRLANDSHLVTCALPDEWADR